MRKKHFLLSLCFALMLCASFLPTGNHQLLAEQGLNSFTISAADYYNTHAQGAGGWYYLYGQGDDFYPMRYIVEDKEMHSVSGYWQGPGWNQHSNTSDNIRAVDSSSSARMYKVEYSGSLSISGTGVAKNIPAGEFSVKHQTFEGNVNTTLFSTKIANEKHESNENSVLNLTSLAVLQNITVQRGDKLYFVLSKDEAGYLDYGLECSITLTYDNSSAQENQGDIALGFKIPNYQEHFKAGVDAGDKLLAASFTTKQGLHGYRYYEVDGRDTGMEKRAMIFNTKNDNANGLWPNIWHTQWHMYGRFVDNPNVGQGGGDSTLIEYRRNGDADITIRANASIPLSTLIEWTAQGYGTAYIAGCYYDNEGSNSILTIKKNDTVLLSANASEHSGKSNMLDFSDKQNLQGISMEPGDQLQFVISGKSGSDSCNANVLPNIVFDAIRDSEELPTINSLTSYSSGHNDKQAGEYFELFGKPETEYYLMDYSGDIKDTNGAVLAGYFGEYKGFEEYNEITQNKMTPGNAFDAIRGFKAPKSGVVRLSYIVKQAVDEGDGITLKVGVLGESPSHQVHIAAEDTTRIHDTVDFGVKQNEVIYLAIGSGDAFENAYDLVYTEVYITYLSLNQDQAVDFDLGDVAAPKSLADINHPFYKTDTEYQQFATNENGKDNWFYCYGDPLNSYTKMEYMFYDGVWGRPGSYLLIDSSGFHPEIGDDAILIKRIDESGKVRLFGRFNKHDDNGDGVYIRIFKNNELLYEIELIGNERRFADITVDVKRGDLIKYCLGNKPGNNVSYDITDFGAIVEYMSRDGDQADFVDQNIGDIIEEIEPPTKNKTDNGANGKEDVPQNNNGRKALVIVLLLTISVSLVVVILCVQQSFRRKKNV